MFDQQSSTNSSPNTEPTTPDTKAMDYTTPKTKNVRSNSWDELDSEIARMSKDADDLLDSIRLVGSPSPTDKKSLRSNNNNKNRPKSSTIVENLQAEFDRHQSLNDSKNNISSHFNNNDNSEMSYNDDDLSDAGTLPEELKAAISKEMEQAEAAFARAYRKTMLLPNDSSSALDESHKDERAELLEPPVSPEPTNYLLFFVMITVWAIVMGILYFAQDNMLDSDGRFILFERILKRLLL